MPPPAGNKLRVLSVFNRYLERGGEEAAVERIAAVLRPVTRFEECTFTSADWKNRPATTPLQPLWMIYNPASIARLRALQRAQPSDLWLVHNVFPVGSAAVYREAARLRVPIVQYVHNFRPFSVAGYLWSGDHVSPGGLRKDYLDEIRGGTWQNSRAKTAWFAFVLRLMHRLGWWKHVGAWVANSDFVRARFIEAGVPAEDIFTLRYFWKPQPAVPPPRDDGHYLFLGRLIKAKGIDILFQVWKHLEDALGPRTPKLIIGGDGPLREEVAARAGASRFIRYAGQLDADRKREAIAGCRAMLAPSLWWEALGLVTYDAYDSGKPMLAAASGGLTETVIDGKTGLLHPPGDAAELARQILEINDDPARRAEMGRQGRLWLEQNADEAEWQRKFLAAAEHAMNKARPAGP